MRYILSSLAAALVLTGAHAESAPPSRGGLYDSVRVSDVTGDEGGVRIQVNDGPSPTVDFTICEGACLDLRRFPARIEGDRLSFVYVEQLLDLNGKPSGQVKAKVDGRFVPKGLMLKIDYLDNVHDDHQGFSLIPRAKPRR